jgi:hypothetical protein
LTVCGTILQRKPSRKISWRNLSRRHSSEISISEWLRLQETMQTNEHNAIASGKM